MFKLHHWICSYWKGECLKKLPFQTLQSILCDIKFILFYLINPLQFLKE